MSAIAFVVDGGYTLETCQTYERNDVWAAVLQRKGFSVEFASWEDEHIDWTSYDMVIIRNVDNYLFQIEEFRYWLQRLDGLGVNLWNPPDVSLWNLHKSYLLDLKRKGVSIPETIIHLQNHKDKTGVNVKMLMDKNEFSRVVVKPCIGAGSYEIHVVRRKEKEAGTFQTKFDDLVGKMDVVVQEYVEEVTTNGEWSLIYFNTIYSHAVLKRPAAGDFRAYATCGATVAAAVPAEVVRSFSDQVIATIEAPLLFSRVDVVQKRNGTVVHMELEVLDAALYFNTDLTGQAEENAAEAVGELIAKYNGQIVHTPGEGF